jgi:hypothetical protein
MAQFAREPIDRPIDADSKAKSLPLPSFRNGTVQAGLAHLPSMSIFQAGFSGHFHVRNQEYRRIH